MILKTPIGDIVVKKNNTPCDYNYSPLDKKGEIFNVDERYQIAIPVDKNKNNIVECFIDIVPSNEIKIGRNSGENLAAVKFRTEAYVLNIGTRENDYPDTVEYLNNNNGLRKHTKIDDSIEDVIFFVAWKKNDIQTASHHDTWFAADPTLFEV